jgi:hypothetical protein
MPVFDVPIIHFEYTFFFFLQPLAAAATAVIFSLYSSDL